MSNDTKPIEQLLSEIEQYCEAATPGEWRSDDDSETVIATEWHDGVELSWPIADSPKLPIGARDAKQAATRHFIARARTDLPRLVKELREALDELNVANDALENQWALIAQLRTKVAELEAERDYARTELEKLRSLRDKWLALLKPANPDETVEGAIRNLQQAYIAERDNAIEGPACMKEELIKKVKEKQARIQATASKVDGHGYINTHTLKFDLLSELAVELEKVEINV